MVRILKNTEIYGDIPEGDNSSTVDTNDVITATPGLSSWIIISVRVSNYYVIDIDPLQHMCDSGVMFDIDFFNRNLCFEYFQSKHFEI